MPEIVPDFALSSEPTYEVQKNWPDHIYWQYGPRATITTPSGVHPWPAFFKIYSRKDDDDIRSVMGQGQTIQEAEEKCWIEYQRYLACPLHEYDLDELGTSFGTCKNCGLFCMNI